MFSFLTHKLHTGGSTILVYLKISRECFVVLRIMSDSLQSNLSEKDRNYLIDTYGKDSRFKNLLKNIFERGTGKKVENFLDTQNQMVAQHDYQKDPQYMKNVMEIINTPGYDPESVKEAKRQLRQMQLGLPRFPEA